MKTANRICIFMGLFILLAIVFFSYDKQHQTEGIYVSPKDSHMIIVKKDNKKDESVLKETTQGKYVLLNQDGYITVYEMDYQTIYAFTDISYQHLPKELQEKIDQGYIMKNNQELYDFLENYTS